MAIKASATITLSAVRDLQSCTRYYLLQSSTSAKPSKPTTNPPGGSWVTAEPTYTSGSTNSLYFCDLNVFSDGSFAYSDVSLSSSYEAAKAAYNKAVTAESEAAQALANGECIVGTQTASTNAWTGRASFASLQDGQVIMYWLPYAGTSTAATLNLTLSGGGTTGAKNVYINATSRCTTHIAAGNMVQMVYRENVAIGTATYTGWWISRTLNDNTYDRIRFNNNIKAKTAISASRLVVGDSDGFFHLAAGSIFDVDKPILWAGSAIAVNATGTNNYLSFPSCTLRNNTDSTWTATQYETLYLAGTLIGNSFVVASENWLTTAPTNENLTYITKSISRFARNTVECLSYVRELQSYGTQILFEKEKIDTGTPFSEMLLTILAAFAQEESRSLSENVKWGIRKRFEAGEARHKRLIGYNIEGDQYIIIPEEAETVRLVFDLYETGRWSFGAIAKRMEQEGRLTSTGNNRWDESRIYTIIMNEKYVGDVLMQKKYTENHITHKEVKNRDRVVPQYYIRDHHEPIVTRKQYERC